MQQYSEAVDRINGMGKEELEAAKKKEQELYADLGSRSSDPNEGDRPAFRKLEKLLR